MDAAWKTVLLNQFHDILPGSSIARVYEEAEAAYGRVLCVARDVAESGARALTENHPTLGIAVFNSLSWRRRVLVELPEGCVAACGADGQALPVQWAGDRTLAEVEVPSCGWTSLLPGKEVPAISNSVCASTRGLENQHLRVAFDEFGEIVSLFDKDAARELATGNCNQFRMFKDVPRCFDAWDIDRTYERMPVELPETARFERVTSGPLVASLRITRKLNDSTMTQTVSLKSDVRRVDFETTVDWQETHKLLKVAFPVDFHAEEGVHEIQFGHIRRPNHRSRKYDEDRFEVCNHKWSALMEENRGFAVLNDCKYGVSVLGNCISLTLLRAPTTPDFTADRGIQKFTYSFYTWNGTFMDSDVVREAYDLNIPAMTVQGSAGSRSLFEVSEPNVIIEAVKPAEDGSLDIIVRLYECKHAAVKCTLTTVLPFVDAWESDMLERSTGKLEHRSGLCHLDFRPFEIKTLRFVSDHTDETKFRG
jgi:alpha-mannosidase